MFLVELTYISPLEKIDQYLDAHSQFLDTYYQQGKFIVSGRKVPRTGGVILVNVEERGEVEQIFQEDPFAIHDLAAYEILEFLPTKYAEAFAPFLNPQD